MADRSDAPAMLRSISQGGRREREFRKYAEAVTGLRASSQEAGESAASSADVPLTAFAQLVALRLDAKRVLVSLFDKKSQYVLAEATQSLSLQRDSDHREQDAMFFGTTVLPRADDWYSETLRIARKMARMKGSAGEEDAMLMLTDLPNDERYCKHQHVVGAPFIRSYIGVPLVAPTGYAIGCLAVLDDKPRVDGIGKECVKVMRDVAASIVTHLELARIQTTHQRSMRMVQGLSRFMEGKSSLNDDTAHDNEHPDHLKQRQGAQTDQLGGSARTHALNTASNAERVYDARESLFDHSEAHSRRHSLSNHSSTSHRASQATMQRAQPLPIPPHIDRGVSKRPLSSNAHQLQEDAVSKDVSQAFGRAAALIRQALDTAGVIFLDASAGAFGSLRNPDDASSGKTASDSESVSTATGSEPGSLSEASSRRSPTRTQACRHLASAYENGKDGGQRAEHGSISEKFLRSLLKRFPFGKVYNFGEEGILTSSGSEHSDTGQSDLETTDQKRADIGSKAKSQGRPHKRYSDSLRLQRIFPGIRSFAVMPMWDEQKGRFMAGAMIWSYNAARLFSYQDDLNYVSAFCDVLMAEVGRIDIQADSRSKTTFISSISHELRSPLHGILGSVEFLQDETDDPASRQQMIQMIDTCGRSLLDIVNNLLEHAHASSGHKPRTHGTRAARRARRPSTSPDPVHDLAVLAEEVLYSTLYNTPQPAIPVGASDGTDGLADNHPLKVVLDVDLRDLSASGWNFHVNAGAFRRILQNLAVNAIKYTDNGGYFKCRLSMSESPVHNKKSTVFIECSDSGRGMSEAFLRRGLYQAFKQENSVSQGTGLGLSLVRNLVVDMGGKIEVASTQGVGTSIMVALPLMPGLPTEDNVLLTGEAKQVKGLTFSLVGLSATPEQNARSAESMNMLRDSVNKVCCYLGLQPSEQQEEPNSHPQIYIVSERHAISTSSTTSPEQEPFLSRPCVIICDSVSSSRRTAAAVTSSMARAIAISQPVGPNRLLQAITLCLSKAPEVTGGEGSELSPEQYDSNSAGPTPMSDLSELSWAITEPGHSGAATPTPTMEDPLPQLPPLTLSKRPSIDPRKSSVLLVDDNPVNVTLLQRYMKKLKRQNIIAVNGLEAVEKFRGSHASHTDNGRRPGAEASSPVPPDSPPSAPQSHPISVIFMDITMPVMDGLEATRRIRTSERALGLKPAIIVALTALASPHARQEAYGSGVDLFLTKPVRFRDIEQMFKDWEADAHDHEAFY